MNKATVIGAISLATVISLIIVFSTQSPINIFPQPITQQPWIQQHPDLESYVGTLKTYLIVSYFNGSGSHADLGFEDGRNFRASLELAQTVNLTYGQIYRVSFNQSMPNVAVQIQEEYP